MNILLRYPFCPPPPPLSHSPLRSCFLRAKAIGIMHMLDQGERDDKIICVCADDPEFRHLNDISELADHRCAPEFQLFASRALLAGLTSLTSCALLWAAWSPFCERSRPWRPTGPARASIPPPPVFRVSLLATPPRVLPSTRLKDIRRFFEDYKKNENKEVAVDEFHGAEEAMKSIKESM